MKTRFAPSPTGYLHLGNIRTALFNALLAYRNGGLFLLRIEDTDFSRSTQQFSDSIQRDLQWLGLQWDKNEAQQDLTIQSQRQMIYEYYYTALQASGEAYACFCTETRLASLHEQQKAQKHPPGYDGKCRALKPSMVELKKKQGEPFNLRLRIPAKKKIFFKDMIKGKQIFNSDAIYDFIIRRSNGSPTFLYCNALDDALMGITHVLRGEDHLSNTPRQILILQALKLSLPDYGHLPLIILQEGSAPLSKRESSLSLHDLRTQGYSALALLNYLARLGHTIDSHALMEFKELADHFLTAHINKASARIDTKQLDFWQKQAIKHQSKEVFWKSLNEITHKRVPVEAQGEFVEMMQAFVLLPSEAQMWAELLFKEPFEYTAEMKQVFQDLNVDIWSQLLAMVHAEKNTECLPNQLKDYLNTFETSVRKGVWKVIRLALTGRFDGPELVSIIRILGVKRVYHRLSLAAALS